MVYDVFETTTTTTTTKKKEWKDEVWVWANEQSKITISSKCMEIEVHSIWCLKWKCVIYVIWISLVSMNKPPFPLSSKKSTNEHKRMKRFCNLLSIKLVKEFFQVKNKPIKVNFERNGWRWWCGMEWESWKHKVCNMNEWKPSDNNKNNRKKREEWMK